MNQTSIARRIEKGWSPENARGAAPRRPLWMVEAEAEAGMDIVELVKIERANGYTWTDIATGLCIDKNLLTWWVMKWRRLGLITE